MWQRGLKESLGFLDGGGVSGWVSSTSVPATLQQWEWKGSRERVWAIQALPLS